MELWVQILVAGLLAALSGILGYIAFELHRHNEMFLTVLTRLENHEGRIGGLESTRANRRLKG